MGATPVNQGTMIINLGGTNYLIGPVLLGVLSDPVEDEGKWTDCVEVRWVHGDDGVVEFYVEYWIDG